MLYLPNSHMGGANLKGQIAATIPTGTKESFKVVCKIIQKVVQPCILLSLWATENIFTGTQTKNFFWVMASLSVISHL